MRPALNELFAVSTYGPGGTLSMVNLPSALVSALIMKAGGGPTLSIVRADADGFGYELHHRLHGCARCVEHDARDARTPDRHYLKVSGRLVPHGERDALGLAETWSAGKEHRRIPSHRIGRTGAGRRRSSRRAAIRTHGTHPYRRFDPPGPCSAGDAARAPCANAAPARVCLRSDRRTGRSRAHESHRHE